MYFVFCSNYVFKLSLIYFMKTCDGKNYCMKLSKHMLKFSLSLDSSASMERLSYLVCPYLCVKFAWKTFPLLNFGNYSLSLDLIC